MTRRLLNLGILGALACGAPAERELAKVPPVTSALPPPVLASPPDTVRVQVTHSAPDRFHVVYTLPEARAELYLQRGSHGVRAHWQPVDAKLVHDPAHDRDTLAAESPRTRFEVDIPTDDVQPEKDYRNHLSFTDGGRLLYTGHLAATAKKEWTGTVTYVGGEGETVIAHGAEPGPTVTLPMGVDGTYVYFGKAKPLATDDFVGMIDPGLPAAVRTDLDTMIPQLFEYYGEGLGRPTAASEKPLLFATYAKKGPGTSIGGGVMPPRVVNFDFEFAEDPTPKWVLERIEYTIAHESAHLWNGDLYHSDSSWIREGTADALAYDTLRKLGHISEKDYLYSLSSTVSLCTMALAEGHPFSEAMRPNHFKEVYWCGHAIAVLSEAAAKESLVAFLKEVFAGPNNEYDENRYIEVLRAKDPAAGAFVKTFAKDKLPDPVHDLPNALKKAGVGVEPGKPDASFDERVGAYAMRAVLAPGCVEALELEGDWAVAATVTTAGACGDAQPGDRLTTIAGVDYRHKGTAMWDAALAQCKKDGLVHLGRKDKPEVTAPCTKMLRSPTPYTRVTKAP